jgi:peptidoglycan hydrolase-like protein with peptidoglycan-binding domain
MARLKKKKFITARALSQLPLQAGSALAKGAGKALFWGISRYARAPLANTSILALTVFTAMAGSNALYFQENRHPSPFFGPAPDYEAGLPQPVTPAVRQNAVTLPPIVVIDETGSVREAAAAPAAPVEPLTAPIGNADVIELQRKLTTLGLYDGKVDGVFGPKTSGAIRRFEERAGLVPKGELTKDLIEAVASAPMVLPQAEATPPRTLAVIPIEPAVQPAATLAQPAVAVAETPTQTLGTLVATNEITGSIPPANVGNPAAPEDAFQPLPTPEPLSLSLEAATAPRVLAPHRDLPDSPREVLSLAVATAKNGIQALASVIENGPQLGPSNPQVAVAPTPATQSIAPTQNVPVQTAAVQQPMPPLATTTPTPVVIAAAPIAPAPTIAPAPSVMLDEPAPVVVAETAPVDTMPQIPVDPMTDRELIAKVQRGLTSLGFLRGEIDGVAGEATAKAIRNFEVYYNYQVTGRVSPALVDLLVAAGAQI